MSIFNDSIFFIDYPYLCPIRTQIISLTNTVTDPNSVYLPLLILSIFRDRCFHFITSVQILNICILLPVSCPLVKRRIFKSQRVSTMNDMFPSFLCSIHCLLSCISSEMKTIWVECSQPCVTANCNSTVETDSINKCASFPKPKRQIYLTLQ